MSALPGPYQAILDQTDELIQYWIMAMRSEGLSDEQIATILRKVADRYAGRTSREANQPDCDQQSGPR